MVPVKRRILPDFHQDYSHLAQNGSSNQLGAASPNMFRIWLKSPQSENENPAENNTRRRRGDKIRQINHNGQHFSAPHDVIHEKSDDHAQHDLENTVITV